MAKTTYIATDANGKVHTRSTQRVYTHTVVYREDKNVKLEWANSAAWRSQDGKNYDYHAKCIENGKHLNLMHFDHYKNDTARHAADVAEAVKYVGGMSRTEWLDDAQAKRVASVERTDFTIWHNAGWCGRFDLAQKLAAQYSDVQILTATAK